MNTRFQPSTDDISLLNNVAATKLLQKWGYSGNPSLEMIEMAALARELVEMRVGEAVVRLNLATQADVDIALKEKPASTQTLEYLAERFDGIRPEIQRIVALQDGMPYYRQLPPPHVQHEDPEIVSACARLEAALSVTPSGEACLVFLDHGSAKRYNTMGRQEQMADPIRQKLGRAPILAVGARNVVLSRLKTEAVIVDELELPYITPESAQTAVQKKLLKVIEYAMEKRSSNIAIQPASGGLSVIRYRRFGDLMAMPGYSEPLSAGEAIEMATSLHSWSNAAYTQSKERVQGTLQAPAGGRFNFRTSENQVSIRTSFTMPDTLGGHPLESMSIRLLPRNELNVRFADLNMDQAVVDAVDDVLLETQGLVLAVGPTSSGKSTLIHAALNADYELYGDKKNRLSAEDPVEKTARGLISHSITKAYGFDVLMQELLRQNPDRLFLGEMRDRSSASIGVRAAQTGHLVFATLHANDSILAVSALLSYINNHYIDNGSAVLVSPYDMVESLSLIIAQRLVGHLCSCAEPLTEDEQESAVTRIQRYMDKKGLLPDQPKDEAIRKETISKVVAAVKAAKKPSECGCKKCENYGFIGELPINEIFTPTSQCKALLHEMIAANRMSTKRLEKYRGATLFESALKLVAAGKTPVKSLFI